MVCSGKSLQGTLRELRCFNGRRWKELGSDGLGTFFKEEHRVKIDNGAISIKLCEVSSSSSETESASAPLTLGGAPAGLCCGQARTASERIKTRDIHKCATALREILM